MTYYIHGTRTSTIMRKIIEIFADHTHKTGRKKLFTARFMLDQLPGCTATIVKARKYLGVEAKWVAGKHCWLLPKRSLEDALKLLGHGSKASVFKVKKSREERKQAAIPGIKGFLQDIGTAYKYICPAKKALEEIGSQMGKKYSLGVYEAKRELGIISERDEDGGARAIWYWLWPSRDIQDWIYHRVEKAPVPFETLSKEAEKLGWNYRALRYNLRLNTGMVTLQKIDGVFKWGRVSHDND